MIKLYKPSVEDLWFRKELLSDEKTMSYNHHWGGVISFPKKDWEDWYDYWLVNTDHKRYYRYLLNENDEYVGEIAYHFDGNHYIANIIVHFKYRNKGYGKEGLILLCDVAKENGLKELYDDIAIDNPAIKMFLKLGFKEEYRNKEIIMLKKNLLNLKSKKKN